MSIKKSLQKYKNKIINYVLYKVNYFLNTHFYRINTNNNTVIIASAHKVGSTWLTKILRDLSIFKYTRVPTECQPNPPKSPGLLSLVVDKSEGYVNNLNQSYIFKSHSLPPLWKPKSKVKFVTVFRDPRDVVISNIFYLANLEPKYGGWPILNKMDNAERIKHYLTKAEFDLELFEKWYDYPNVHKMFYEDMLNDIKGEIEKVVEYLEVEIDDRRLNAAIHKNSFKKLSGGRKLGHQDKASFYRKGTSGDWMKYFDEEIIDFYKRVHDGRWNQLLVKLGYENIHDWKVLKDARN